MPTVIDARKLSKRYRIGTIKHREDTIRDAVVRGFRTSLATLRNGLRNGQSGAKDWMWALRDVNFSIEQGDVVGIIGGNGAGKSTLLKILSRITDPTEGEVVLDGRVASLLEVGTGFHPDLTGRENIFLNGAMLGMSKVEISSKFDEIVAFAELEKFLDTPVKHYSSGMYVRLGFAVAAHLDPEILIVDEVLAVGDMAFQKKCLGKMGDFGRSGRTILFVSHNIPAVATLCQKGLVLEHGNLSYEGDVKGAVEHYLGVYSQSGTERGSQVIDLWNSPRRLRQYEPWLRELQVFDGDGQTFTGELAIGAPIRVQVEFLLRRASANFDVRVNFVDLYGQIIFAARSSYERNRDWGSRTGVQEVTLNLRSVPLTVAEYRIEVALVLDDKCVDYVEDAYRLKVLETDYYGTGKIPSTGFLVHEQSWRLK